MKKLVREISCFTKIQKEERRMISRVVDLIFSIFLSSIEMKYIRERLGLSKGTLSAISQHYIETCSLGTNARLQMGIAFGLFFLAFVRACHTVYVHQQLIVYFGRGRTDLAR